MTAAIWSAIAATCAAFCAFCMLLIQRRNLQESVRPEIVLLGWKRSTDGMGDADTETLTITEIKNVGRGLAIHGIVHTGEDRPDRIIVAPTRFFALEPGETRVVDVTSFIWWDKVTKRVGQNGPKLVAFSITVLSWDTQGRRHTTTYRLRVYEPNPGLRLAGDGFDGLGPGIYLDTRETTSTAVWLLKLQKRFTRVVAWASSRWHTATSKIKANRRPSQAPDDQSLGDEEEKAA